MAQLLKARIHPKMDTPLQDLGFSDVESDFLSNTVFTVRNGHAYPGEEYFTQGNDGILDGKVLLTHQIELVQDGEV